MVNEAGIRCDTIASLSEPRAPSKEEQYNSWNKQEEKPEKYGCGLSLPTLCLLTAFSPKMEICSTFRLS